MNMLRSLALNKIGIILNDASPKELNMDIFNVSNKIYETNPRASINIFLSNIAWPYKKVEYGIFKSIDYQNFVGTTIVTSVDQLALINETPHNNKIILYCHDFPWINIRMNGKSVTSLLTNPNIAVYCRLEYIGKFMDSFRQNTTKSKIIKIEELINKVLRNEI